MALDEALYELTGAGLIACAAGLGLVVPRGAVRAGDAFVGYLSQRGAWGEVNRLVEEIKRETLVDAQAALTPASMLVQQIREAITVLEDVRPETDLLHAALAAPMGAHPAPTMAPATRIAAQMIARAAAAHPPHRHVATPDAPSPGPSHGAQALLHRLLTAVLREPGLLIGLGAALQEFLTMTPVAQETSVPAGAIPAAPPTSAPVVPPGTQPASPPVFGRGAVPGALAVRSMPADLTARPPDPASPRVPASSAGILPPPEPPPVRRPDNVVALPDRLPRSEAQELADRLGLGEAFAIALLATGVAGVLEQIRAAHGLTPKAYARFLRTLESQACPPGAAPLRLEEMAAWLTGLVAALTKPSNEDSETRRLKAAAAQALADGDLEAAMQQLKQVRRTVRDGRRRIEERLREDIMLLNQQMATEAGVIARQAEMELTRRDYAAAAELFAEARDSLPRSELQSAWLYGMRQGEALFRLGDEFEDHRALREAARAYESCLAMTARDEMPKNWVAAQCGLALAYLRLSEQDSTTEHLQNAIAAWRGSLTVLETLDEPGQTIVSRRHLARALFLLGERETDAARAASALNEAAAAYRALIAGIGRDRSPLDWAEAQMGLASTLLMLDERTNDADPAHLAEAIAALEAASSAYDRDRQPAEWAMARMNLGNALLSIGERDKNVGRLDEAARCFEEALTRQTRATAPREWALMKSNLANAIAAIAESSADPARLELAAATYREALMELKGEDDRLRRAIAELNLGTVLVRLAAFREPQRHRIEAMAAMMTALEIFEALGAANYAQIAQVNLRSLHKLLDWPPAAGQAQAKAV